MKICITAVSGDLDAQIDPRFGRCQYFLIVDSETMTFETVPNIASSAASGAGIQGAQVIASKGAKVLITGNVGPNAFQALSAAGIKVVTGAFGNIKEAIKQYERWELKEVSSPTVRGHHGMGGGRGRGRW